MYKLSTSEQVGQQIIARRRVLGLTQQDVASRLGISQNRLSELENQPAQLTIERLLALMGVLGLELVLQERPKGQATDQSKSEW